MKLEYPTDLKPWELEPHFARHMSAMTSEALHSKADIAMQLAWRDQTIDRLEAAGKEELRARERDLDVLQGVRDRLEAVLGIVTSALACGQWEKLDDARRYLSDEQLQRLRPRDA